MFKKLKKVFTGNGNGNGNGHCKPDGYKNGNGKCCPTKQIQDKHKQFRNLLEEISNGYNQENPESWLDESK